MFQIITTSAPISDENAYALAVMQLGWKENIQSTDEQGNIIEIPNPISYKEHISKYFQNLQNETASSLFIAIERAKLMEELAKKQIELTATLNENGSTEIIELDSLGK